MIKKTTLIFVLLLIFGCEKIEEDTRENFFIYHGEIHNTPNAYYGVENDGFELCISNFSFDYNTNEYSGSGSGVDFVKLKSSKINSLPTGTFKSGINWGDTSSDFLGIVLVNVDTLYSRNYVEMNILSGTISIEKMDKEYNIVYDIIVEDSTIISGNYKGVVYKN